MFIVCTNPYASHIYDYSYIRLGKPWDCLTSANFRLEWRSHSSHISIKLHKQLSSTYGNTGNRTLYLPHGRQEWYNCTTEPTNKIFTFVLQYSPNLPHPDLLHIPIYCSIFFPQTLSNIHKFAQILNHFIISLTPPLSNLLIWCLLPSTNFDMISGKQVNLRKRRKF